MKRYKMHECEDERHYPPLDVILERDHDIVVNGLQSLVSALRDELKQSKSKRDSQIQNKPRPKIKPLIEIGSKRNGAVITGHECGLHILKCGCGAIFRRGRTALVSDTPWRCMTCFKDGARSITLDAMADSK